MLRNKVLISAFLFIFLFISSAYALNFPTDSISITTFTGNLTNLSEMQDVNIPSPSNNEVLTYSSGIGKWISQGITIIQKWIIDDSNGYLYNNSDTLFFNDTKLNDTFYFKSNPFGYFNSTNPQPVINPFDQSLNTTNNVTFVNITSTGFFLGDGSKLTGIIASAANYSLLSFVSNITDFPTNLSFFTDDLGNRGYTSLSNFTNDPGYLTSFTESDPLWTGNQSNYFNTTDIIGFGYYNSTDFVITDYYTQTQIDNFGFFNNIANFTGTLTNGKGCKFVTGTGIVCDQDYLTSFTESDPLWTANQSNYFNTTDILGFNYYNSTDFDINDYYLNSNPFGYFNTTNPQTELDPLWTANQSSYSTTAEILAFGYYNATDFIITDYFTKSDILGFNYYNSTNFNISDYFTSAQVLGFNYYNSTDFNISDYFTSAQILGFNYYNSTNFNISDYFTSAQVLGFNYYNSTDFNITDYYTKTDVDTNISDANTSMKNYVDATFITQANEGNLDVNRSDFWDDLDIPTDLNNLLTLDLANITNQFITAVDGIYLYMSGTTATFNETKLNETINLIDTATNTSMASYVDATFITQANEGNLNVNSSNFWDALDTVGDILGSLITNDLNWINQSQANESGDLRWVNITGDTWEGDMSAGDFNLTDIQRAVFNTTGCDEGSIAGTLCWNPDDMTLNIVTGVGNVIQVGQEQWALAKNGDSIPLLNGQIVTLVGSSGDRGLVARADANNASLAARLSVVTIDSCAVSADCAVTTFGRVRGLNTSSWAAGTLLYLSADGSGNLTSTVPPFPNFRVLVAFVVRSHANDGIIFVQPQLDYTDGITMDTLGLIGDFIQTDYTIKSQEGHASIGQNVFTIEMNGTTGQDIPHLILQPGGAEQASIWVRSGIVAPEAPNCLNNTNRTDSSCYATEGGFTWNVDFNTSIDDGADWGVTGDLDIIKNSYFQGNTNMFGDLNLNANLIFQGFNITNVSSNGLWSGTAFIDSMNESLNQLIFAVEETGPTGVEMPKFWLQNGGDGQASGISRSFMIVNEVVAMQNTTNITDCTANGVVNIDCNSSTTGADLFVGDDIEVGGDFWLKDTEGDWHFLTRTLTLQDRLFSNLVLNNFNGSLDVNNFTITESKGETFVINIDANETITSKLVDSITITQGTNITPVHNFIYYQDKNNPTLTRAATEPSVDHAEVSQFIQGNNYTYASIVDEQNEENTIKRIFTRFEEQGPLYVTGYSQAATSTNINFTGGTINIIVHEDISTNVLDTDDLFFYIEDGTDYVQLTGLDSIDEYSDGIAISNNKYFNVVFGVIHNDINGGNNRMIAIIQEGTTEYNGVTSAETDSFELTNFFTEVSLLNKMYIPVARVVMQRTGGVNTIQTLNSGNLFIDLRGITSSAGGAAGSPAIDDHSLLNNLNFASSGHTGNLDLGAFNFSVDTDDLFVNSNTGNIGIGTTSPNSKLEIRGGGLDINEIIRFRNSGGTSNEAFLQISGGDLNINVVSGDLVLSPSSNVGIGTSTPQNKLNVLGDGNFTGNLYSNEASVLTSESDPLWTANQSNYFNTTDILGFNYYNSTDFNITDYFTSAQILGFNYYNSTDFDINDYYLNSNPFGFFNSTNPQTELDPLWTANQSSYVPYSGADTNLVLGDNNFSVNTSTLFVDTNSGNVGIGTISPSDKLNVNGTMLINVISNWGVRIESASDEAVFSLQNTNAGGREWIMGDAPGVSAGTFALLDNTAGLVRMAILGSGDFGIGTATPQNKLNVIGDINSTGLYYGNGSQLTGINTNIFDQTLNTTSNVAFNKINMSSDLYTGYISDLSDTNFISFDSTEIITSIGGGSFQSIYDASGLAFQFGLITLGNTGNIDAFGNITGDWINASSDICIEGGNCLSESLTSFTELDPLWTANQSSYFNTTDILGFNYYNSTDFNISDYYTQTQIDNFGFFNNIANFTGTLTNGKGCKFVTGTGIVCDQDYSTTVGTVTSIATGGGISGGTITSSGTLTVAGNTALTQDSDGLSVTNDAIGDTQLAFNTGQALTTTSNPTFNNQTITDCIIFTSGGKICSA